MQGGRLNCLYVLACGRSESKLQDFYHHHPYASLLSYEREPPSIANKFGTLIKGHLLHSPFYRRLRIKSEKEITFPTTLIRVGITYVQDQNATSFY